MKADRVFLAALLLAAATSLAADAAALPVEYVTVRHAVYEDLEALWARGVLDSFAIWTRPLARTDVAQALVRAARRSPGVSEDLHYQRAAREFARELHDLESPGAPRETGPILDSGTRERRFRLSAAGHIRGDYDEKREAAHFRLRDETSASARLSLELWPAFGAYEEIGITRIRGQREYIDAIALHSDLESAVFRAGLTARTGPLTAALGYDLHRWGPGRRGTLLLSDAAGPVTFISLQGEAGGRITAKALTAILARSEDRFLSAHRLEIRPGPRLTLGLAEAVRYRSDGIDLLYASGLIPYALAERIHIRDASSDSSRGLERANVMAAIDASFAAARALTLYGEVLIDDLATEDRSMPDRFAYQFGFMSHRPYGPVMAAFQGEYTRVRRFTYAVDYGQDFVHRDRSLGYALGPDVENVFLELRIDLARDWQARWSGDFTNAGQGYLGEAWSPSIGPVSTVGFAGVVEERRELWTDLRWLPRDNVDASVGAGYRRIENEGHEAGRTRSAWLLRLAADVRY